VERNLFFRLKIGVRSGQVWSSLVKSGQTWSNLVKPGQVWSNLVKSGQTWSRKFHLALDVH